MKNKNILSKGFTLVELLIVIALIAILSVAVLATINPIEQTNKARDAKVKNDAAEVLSAYERYYASTNVYPWNVATGNLAAGTTLSVSANKVAFIGVDPRFGVAANTATGETGPLIMTSELKGAFSGKEYFKASVVSGSVDAMYVYHGSSSNYVCFCPKAVANKSGVAKANLKCLTVVTAPGANAVADSSALLDAATAGCASPTDAQVSASTFCAAYDATTHGYANLICVPEGTIAD